MKSIYLFSILLFIVQPACLHAQMTISVAVSENGTCNCSYNQGNHVTINEVMIMPYLFNGSLYGNYPGSDNGGEWLELYNSDTCNLADISCYILGNNTNESNAGLYGLEGGIVIPPGTHIPAGGFAIIRGINAEPVPSTLLFANGGNTIEIVLDNSSDVCIGNGYRFWLPDAGGWLALYDNNGNPVDAISWMDVNNCYTSYQPCVPASSSCSLPTSLMSYDNIPSANKNYICNFEQTGFTIGRNPDGGSWNYNNYSNPTYGFSNIGALPANIYPCNGNINVTIAGGNPPYSYKWNDPAHCTTPNISGLCSGTYCITITDAGGISTDTCFAVSDLQIFPNPTANPEDICEGSFSELQAYNADNYSWNNGAFTASITVGPSSSTIYSVTASTFGGCSGSANVFVNVFPVPEAYVTTQNDFCSQGIAWASVNASGGTFPYNYFWSCSPNDTTYIGQMTSGMYSVTVTDAANCSYEVPFSISDVPGPTAAFVPHPYEVLLGNSIDFFNNSFGNISLYFWDFGDGTFSSEMEPEHVFSALGEYSVLLVVASDTGCVDSIRRSVFIRDQYTLYMPNAFTPNGDQCNDFFSPFATSIDLEEYEMRIFNRWGNEVFVTHNINQPWTGIVDNKPVPEDVYVYRIFFRDKDHIIHEVIGNITLIY